MTTRGHLAADAPVGGAPVTVQQLVRHPGGGGKTGERRQPRRGARVRPRLSQPREIGKHPRRLPLGGARLVHLVRPARGPSPARVPKRGRRLPRRRPRCRPSRQYIETARRRDPFPAPRRRPPLPHRHRRGVGNHGRHPPRRAQSAEETRRHPDRAARAAGADPGRSSAGCATARCCWSALPARCAARSWRRSCSATSNAPTRATS